MTEKEALKLALEALQSGDYWKGVAAVNAIKEALAQPTGNLLLDSHNAVVAARTQSKQEPVAWPCVIAKADFSENTVTLTMQCTDYKVSVGDHWLSTTPPQRTWVGLTEKEILECRSANHLYFYKAIEAKLKEKNA